MHIMIKHALMLASTFVVAAATTTPKMETIDGSLHLLAPLGKTVHFSTDAGNISATEIQNALEAHQNTLDSIRTADASVVQLNDVDLHINSTGTGRVYVNGHEHVGTVVSALRMGLLLANGTYLGKISIMSNIDLIANAPLLEHIVELRGDLTIANTGIALLSSIVALLLTTVTGSVKIELNDRLSSLDGGFPALTMVRGTVTVENNAALADLDGGFPALTSVGGYIRLQQNPALARVDGGFPVLASVAGEVRISHNAQLATLAGGLPAVMEVGDYVKIEDNAQLTTLANGFASCTTARGLVISLNPLLGSLDTSFPALISVRGNLVFNDNGNATCANSAARLCPLQPLRQNWHGIAGPCCRDFYATTAPTASPAVTPECRWVECGHNNGPEAGDRCPDENARCAPLTELHETRCCGDRQQGGWVQSTNYRMPAAGQTGGVGYSGPTCSVWHASSSDSRIGCRHAGLTYAQSNAMCRSVGGRTCTRAEVQASCVSGDGCSHDYDLIWTSGTN